MNQLNYDGVKIMILTSITGDTSFKRKNNPISGVAVIGKDLITIE